MTLEQLLIYVVGPIISAALGILVGLALFRWVNR